MIIACAIDDNYIRHCAVMLRSLYESNPEEDIRVFIMHGPINEAEKAKLAAYLGTFLSSASFIRIKEEALRGFPEREHLTIASYYRLLLPDVLPSAIQKVLYLDCDLLIVDSLSELWRASFDGYPLAAVIDRGQKENCKRVGLSKGSVYFNGGVMLIDINKWRKSDLMRVGRDLIINNPAAVKFADQDILNYCFDGKWSKLDTRWNVLPHIWRLDEEWTGVANLLTSQDIAARDKPAVVHFAGPVIVKPWHYYCKHPWKNRYLELKIKTPWASAPLDSQPRSLLSGFSARVLFGLKRLAKGAAVKRNKYLQVRRMTGLTDRRPLYLNVETTNVCNARCVFCCYGKMKSKPQILPLDIFEKVIREYSELGGGAVTLTPVPGDVLLDPHLIKRYEILGKYKNIDQISFTTNGIAFPKYSDEELKYIIRSSFMIQFSIGGLDRELYKSLYQVDQLENVLNSVSRVLDIKKAINDDAHIHLSFRTNDPRFEEMHREQLGAFKKRGCLVSHISTYGNFGGLVKGGEVKDVSILSGAGPIKSGICAYPLLMLSVLPNGSITNCGCVDVTGEYLNIGDAHSDTLEECWRSEKREKILKSFSQGKLIDLCRQCSMFRRVEHFGLPPYKNIRSYQKLPLEFYMLYGG